MEFDEFDDSLEAHSWDANFFFPLNIKKVDIELCNTTSTKFSIEHYEKSAILRLYVPNQVNSYSDLFDTQSDFD